MFNTTAETPVQGLSLQLAQEIQDLPELAVRLQSPDLTLVISLSGGLDSAAMMLWAKNYYPHARIIAHHQAIVEDWYSTIPYCRALCQTLNVPLYIHQGVYIQRWRTFKNGRKPRWEWQLEFTEIADNRELPFDREETAALYGVDDLDRVAAGILDFAEARGAPPTQKIRWCTDYFKTRVFDRFVRLNRVTLGENAVALIGYRRRESPKRAKEPVGRLRDVCLRPNADWPNGWRMYDLHPVLDWSKQDTVDYLLRHSIEPHVAYQAQGLDISRPVAEGGPRFSCVHCIFANGCHMAAAAAGSPAVPQEETDHARKVFRRVLRFQRDTGMTWQQSGASGLNQVAAVLGEPSFQKEQPELEAKQLAFSFAV